MSVLSTVVLIHYRVCDSPLHLGIYYNTMKNPPTDERILGRLIQADEDCHPVVKKRLKKYKELLPVIEEHFEKVSVNEI